jgi:thymidylate synthase
MQNEEYQYINLIKKILDNGFWEEGRNGKTKSIFGEMMRFSLKDNTIPILTTKKISWKTCIKELLWFIRGESDNKILKDQGVHIWDGNTTREFLDSRGLHHYPEDIAGPIYGAQWRNFNAEYKIYDQQKKINKTILVLINKKVLINFNKLLMH